MFSNKITETPHGEEEPETAGALQLWVVLARCFDAVAEHARQSAEELGLHLTEFGVLEALYHKGDLTLGEVGEKLLISSGNVTRVIDKLERQDLVRRVPCPADRRAVYARLTECGRARIASVFPRHAQAMCQALAGLSPEEQRHAGDLLKRLGLAARQSLQDRADGLDAY